MSSDKKYFLIPASSGLCIQPGLNRTETAAFKGELNQLWHIEEGEDSKVAFRNAGGTDYLHAAGGYKSNAVKQGARQWWNLEVSDTPHAFWIKCDEYPNAYLCNSGGNITPSNTIYIWAKEEYWTQTMLWYFFDYESWSKHKNSKPGVQFSSSGSGDKEDNHELQTKLMEANNKQQILEERLKAAEDRSQELESKEKDHIERQQQCDAKEKELAAREEDLETKQNAALAKERELEARERAMVEKEAVIGGRDSKGDEGSQEEIQNLRDEVTRLRTDMKRTSAERDRLKAKEMELAKLQQAYKELKQSDEDAGSKSTSSDANENSIVGGRIQSDFREEGAARVGSRDTPPGLRTRQARPTTTRGRVAPIQLQREFTRLPRLRAN